MTTNTKNDKAGLQMWSLDDLLSSLDKTVSVEGVKQRTKQRVLQRAYQPRRAAPGLSLAVMFLAASAAAAGVVQVVRDELDAPALDEAPPQVVLGAPAPGREQGRRAATLFGDRGAAASQQTKQSDPQEPKLTLPSDDARAPLRAAQRVTGSPAPTHAATPSEAPAARKPVARVKADSDDPTQVAHAVRALRKEGQPDKARTLLDGYLAQHPQGSLTEEALALSIEAWLKDSPSRAAAHARRYLASYPNGRYRKVAQRALAQFER